MLHAVDCYICFAQGAAIAGIVIYGINVLLTIVFGVFERRIDDEPIPPVDLGRLD